MLTTGTEESNPFVIQDNPCMKFFQRVLTQALDATHCLIA